jgi:hypothetical protein
MTFYNIIFGILFLGACRQLLLLAADTSRLWMAATVAVLIFNDVVNTSHVLEGSNAKPYSIGMKLIDLTNFLILSLALIALSPAENPFGVAIPAKITELLTLRAFWLLLVVYWCLAVLWNQFAGLYRARNYPSWLKKASYFVVFPLLLMAVTAPSPPGELAKWGSFAAFLFSAVYLFICKPLAARGNAGVTG